MTLAIVALPNAQVCYHVHLVEANLVSRFVEADNLPLPPLEMPKGLDVWQENPDRTLAIFANHLDVTRTATDIEQRFQVELPQVPALLIRGHRLTVWAPSRAAACNFVELLEYIFRYMIIARQIKIRG